MFAHITRITGAARHSPSAAAASGRTIVGGRPQAEHDQGRPGHGLRVDVQVYGREHEHAEGVHERPPGGGHRRDTQAAGERHEGGRAQRDVEREQERDPQGVAPQGSGADPRGSEQWIQEGNAFVNVGIPVAELARPQPFRHVLAERVEQNGQVAEVEDVSPCRSAHGRKAAPAATRAARRYGRRPDAPRRVCDIGSDASRQIGVPAHVPRTGASRIP